MIESIHPSLLYFLGAAVALAIPNGSWRAAFMLLIPVAGIIQLFQLPEGGLQTMMAFGHALVLLRVDTLSFLFALIFSIAAFLSLLFAWHVRDPVQQIASLFYIGSAIGAVFAGDLVTLFVFWEGTAVGSVFLIWARRTEGAYHAGLRYLLWQVGSGVLLLAGLILHAGETGSIAFAELGLVSAGTWLIFIAFGIKCAFPLLHNWLPDAYPAATATGTVVLSAFTTKLAVYALARAYPGTELLVAIGGVMVLFPLFHAAIEDNLRRVLAYSLNNQLGFMVAGIGVGTPLAMNGAISQAFAHILYKALLFMSMGAVLHRTGTARASELGGLHRSMPWTALLCMIGAASAAGLPLLSGFVTKSLTLSGVADAGYALTWVAMMVATVGVVQHAGIRLPHAAFFGRDRGLRCREAPWNMLAAMAVTAALCIGIGVWPDPLYRLLPHPVDYQAYTVSHVVTVLQLVLFALLGFVVLKRAGLYPAESRTICLDTDWLYRRLARDALLWLARRIDRAYDHVTATLKGAVGEIIAGSAAAFGPLGTLGRPARLGNAVAMITVLLLVVLVIAFSSG